MLSRTGLALLAGVLLAQAFEPVGLVVLLPVGIMGLALAVRGLPARRAWLPGLAFGLGFHLVLLFWMRVVGYDAWLALAGLQAAFHAPLGVLAAWVMRLRGGPVWFAAAWVAVETVRSSWPFSGMPWGRLAYATGDTLWQDALPWVGMTGLSFLLALLGALAAEVVARTGRARVVAAAVAGGVAVVSLVPALTAYPVPTVGDRQVAVVQGDVPGDGSDILLDHRQVTRNHVEATVALAGDVRAGRAPAPDFVVWPENSTAVDPFRTADVNAAIRSASDAIGVPVLVGAMVDSGPENVLNQSIVWEPGVGATDRYTKWHPVPFGEYIPWRGVFQENFGRLALIPRDMLSGTREEPIVLGDTPVAAAICFDVAYDDGIHAQLLRGGQLVVVQTSNAMFIHTNQIDQQFEISRLRAVETGRHVLVAATNGVSGVIAPDGEVVARAGTRTQAVLQEQVSLATGITPAVRLGAWPGRVAVVATLVAAAWSVLTYRRPRPGEGVDDELGRADRDGRPDLQRA
ncbi:apolipoprotein N-acyltransferase [Nocardioides coralli]|uniref:apolipoprotein N-acyltransferase n=1 Tax=Nocardioides coralli TaxID=2872154 RepID=UPI0020175E0F|nr:apolipoprotein N-acyltransferase [Nocardioides coralli]